MCQCAIQDECANMWESLACVIQINNDKKKLTKLVGQCVIFFFFFFLVT